MEHSEVKDLAREYEGPLIRGPDPSLSAQDDKVHPDAHRIQMISQMGVPVVSLYFSRSRFNSAVNSLTLSA